VISDQLEPLCQIILIGDAHPSLTGMNVLVIVEAENPYVSHRAAKTARAQKREALRVVLDDLNWCLSARERQFF